MQDFIGKRFRFTYDRNGAQRVTRGKVCAIDSKSVHLTGGTRIPRKRIVEVSE
ncbi:MAG TPA: hypothetical protein VJ777_22940 [Mycobacterium sp.]|nr:hypothetical protein [Mycobacterium sp.]